jgi:hypothetical protein
LLENHYPGKEVGQAFLLVTIRKRSQVLDFTGVTPRFRIVTYAQ